MSGMGIFPLVCHTTQKPIALLSFPNWWSTYYVPGTVILRIQRWIRLLRGSQSMQ